MKLQHHGQGDELICEVLEEKVVLASVEDALDLMGEAGCHRILLSRDQIAPEFFDLSTRILGDILQKYTNYAIRLAIWGDFSNGSASLRDFIRESNRGGRFFFLPGREEALAALTEAR